MLKGIPLLFAAIAPLFSQSALTVATVGESTLRVTLFHASDKAAIDQLNRSHVLAPQSAGKNVYATNSIPETAAFVAGRFNLKLSNHPFRLQISRRNGAAVQDLEIDPASGSIQFSVGSGPIFGLGEGGQQFDRKGASDPMRNSEDAYNKPFFGGRMPVPWLISDGWALFLHAPQGSIDLGGSQGRFTPFATESALPVDLFVTGFDEPSEAMADYARITGLPSMPPLWALGYEQSHRTIESWEVVSNIASNFRQKKLPCDVLIYLGTGFAPSGWNTGHRSFTFNPEVFPDPPAKIKALKDLHFKIVLHEMDPPKGLHGLVSDNPKTSDPNEVANYWKLHEPLEKLGVNGWWPDEGEDLSRDSRLARIRMYWDGPQIDHPDVRPYTLNRTGYAGMQRYGGWLWSGDVNASWRTLQNHVAIGINTGLSGVPFWGSDIGGFFSTRELTGELYVRWFQFGSFCPIFRAHGRPSRTRFPWGWNTGDMGEPEASPRVPGFALPDLEELHNAAVEPICKKYLELRYRMMPYIYSIAWEAHETGMPLMRAMWLYYRDDPKAAQRGDEYLWGRDVLVAPVVEKGAASRSLYLPKGLWYDFWTNEPLQGGTEIVKAVDLATMPLYVRAGAILPMDPVRQYTAEKVDGPLTLKIYPGADGRITLYDDDGVSFKYEQGEYTRLTLIWNDTKRQLTIEPQNGARVWNQLSRRIDIQLATGGEVRHIPLGEKRIEVKLGRVDPIPH